MRRVVKGGVVIVVAPDAEFQLLEALA